MKNRQKVSVLRFGYEVWCDVDTPTTPELGGIGIVECPLIKLFSFSFISFLIFFFCRFAAFFPSRSIKKNVKKLKSTLVDRKLLRVRLTIEFGASSFVIFSITFSRVFSFFSTHFFHVFFDFIFRFSISRLPRRVNERSKAYKRTTHGPHHSRVKRVERENKKIEIMKWNWGRNWDEMKFMLVNS